MSRIIDSLVIPILPAPMAGGPTTPEVVNAAASVGSFGTLAWGTISAQAAREQAEGLNTDFFGINLFAKQPELDSHGVAVARELAAAEGVELEAADYSNGWDEKLQLALTMSPRPKVVWSMFGTFTAAEVKALHAAGIEAWTTVTNEHEARAAIAAGVDALCVQGPEAGGHRGVWNPTAEPNRSREDSYQRFVEVFQDTDPVLVEETSPDALPAALHVRLVNPTDTAPIDAVRDLPQVDTIVDQVEEVRSATDNLNSIRNATFLLAFVQAVAAIFLIANMVQIAAYNRSTEIGIMRMVGASRWITQAPFVLEAVVASVIGGVLAGLGVFAAKSTIVDSSLASLYQSQLLAPIRTSDIWVSWPLVGIAAILAAAITASVTLRAYVRK